MRSDALGESNKLVTSPAKDDLREQKLGKVPLVLNNAERAGMKKCQIICVSANCASESLPVAYVCSKRWTATPQSEERGTQI